MIQTMILHWSPRSPYVRKVVIAIAEMGLQERVRTVRRGLAGETGERRLRTQGETPNRSLVLRGTENSNESTIPIHCVTLADFLLEAGLESVDLLKMDIEGSEWEVLFSTPTSVLRSVRYILLEYHEVHARFGYAPEKLFAHLFYLLF